jgi:glycosyltransferase involved in cell wall biosynthesis
MLDPVDPRRRPNGRTKCIKGMGVWRVPSMLRHRFAAAGADAVVFSNEADASYATRWGLAPRAKSHVIAPGIDPAKWAFDPQKRAALRNRWLAERDRMGFVLGTAARLVQGKGLETLIEAMATLVARGRRIVLLIAGTGPLEDTLRQMIRRFGIEQHVILLGFVQDMAGFYSGLDAFALCSRTESFGLALTEAMACERAVMATPTHGALAQIRHMHNGYVSAGFCRDAIVEAIRVLVDGPTLCERLSMRALQQACERFTIDQTFDNLLRVLNPRRSPRSTPRTHTATLQEVSA